jgi:hypothetical protein
MDTKYFRSRVEGSILATAQKFSSTFAADAIKKIFGEEETKQYDLKFLVANLTDEGNNGNGFFFKRDLLVAKHTTARLKPFNLNHQEKNIIGVIFDSALASTDSNGNVLEILEVGKEIKINSEDGTFIYPENLKTLSALVGVALYGLVAPDEVQNIISRVDAGEKVDVSMEAWHQGWDFMFLNEETGKCREVQRTKANRHLDDFINRVVGNERICKLPHGESFIFGGIGQVKSGACPNSVVLTVASNLDRENVMGDSIFRMSDLRQLEAASIEPLDKDHNSKGVRLEMNDKIDPKGGVQAPESATVQHSTVLKEDVSLASALAQTSQDLGAVRSERNQANDRIKELEGQIKSEDAKHKKEMDDTKEEKSKVELEKEKLKKANSGYANLISVMTKHPDLKLGNDLISVASSLAEFDDESLKSHIAKLVESQKKANEELASVRRKAMAEALGLSENATDEEVGTVQAKLKAIASSPGMPTNHRPAAPVVDEKAESEEEKKTKAAKEAASQNGTKSGPKIIAVNRETGHKVTV